MAVSPSEKTGDVLCILNLLFSKASYVQRNTFLYKAAKRVHGRQVAVPGQPKGGTVLHCCRASLSFLDIDDPFQYSRIYGVESQAVMNVGATPE